MRSKRSFSVRSFITLCGVALSANASRAVEPQVLKDHTGHIRELAFSRNGKILASGSDDKTVRLWNLQTGRTEHVLTGHKDWVASLAFSSDGKLLCSATFNGDECKLWDVQSGRQLRNIEISQTLAHSIAFSPDGTSLVMGTTHYGSLKVWKPSSGVLVQTLKGYSDIAYNTASVHALSFSPSGKILAAGNHGGEIHLWELATGKLLQRIKAYSTPKWIHRMEVSPDAAYIASALLYDEQVRVWDVNSSERRWVLDTGRVRGLAFSRNGNILATISSDKLMLWDVQSGKILHTQETKNGYDAAFSPDRRYLAAVGVHQEIYVWKAADLLPAKFDLSNP